LSSAATASTPSNKSFWICRKFIQAEPHKVEQDILGYLCTPAKDRALDFELEFTPSGVRLFLECGSAAPLFCQLHCQSLCDEISQPARVKSPNSPTAAPCIASIARIRWKCTLRPTNFPLKSDRVFQEPQQLASFKRILPAATTRPSDIVELVRAARSAGLYVI